jgi:hypothetical protein
LRDGSKQLVGGGEGRAMKTLGAGKIEIGFINGDHFHDGRKLGEDGGDTVAPFFVFTVVAIEEDRMGA